MTYYHLFDDYCKKDVIAIQSLQQKKTIPSWSVLSSSMDKVMDHYSGYAMEDGPYKMSFEFNRRKPIVMDAHMSNHALHCIPR